MALEDIYNIIGNSSDYYQLYETQKLDIEVKRGDTLNIVLDVSDNGSNYDFTGYDILCQVKRKPTDKTPVLTLNERYEEGKIILAKEALAMMVDAYNYYYDIQIVNQAGDLQTWVEGRLNVKQDVNDYVDAPEINADNVDDYIQIYIDNGELTEDDVKAAEE